MFYKLDKRELLWRKDNRKMLFMILSILFLMVVSFFIGFSIKIKKIEDSFLERMNLIIYHPKDQPYVEYIDSLFTDYEKRANVYLSQKKFKKSPIKGFMLATSAKDAFLSTGIFLPVELALAQAQIESTMGTKGRSPSTNPFNIGEYDSHTAMQFNSTYDGIKAYYSYMTSNYLKCKPIDLLFKNFSNCSGYRYASSPNYEKELSILYFSVKKTIDKKL
jgi:hypothetical protein